ncbi:ankyrin [Aaosphaeria arxii CBS 175.79]|uniref:Ankyrin n=1 Tax=Aaosphaeria arxii CBS 175.79 TaxID=1450172 RepID=A0A6A5Y309_9PLEO|nr:ankyrin [Aaosphaeria arxii CBS 175.79]KAF2019190.1 ankyrin [Aaosphaeria arxii CBS 175.79]
MVSPASVASSASAVRSLLDLACELVELLLQQVRTNQPFDFNIAPKDLAEEVSLLAVECDLIYTDVQEIAHKSQSRPALVEQDDGTLWACLDHETELARRSLRELEVIIQQRPQKSSVLSRSLSLVQKRMQIRNETLRLKLALSKNKICLNITLRLLHIKFPHLGPFRSGPHLMKDPHTLQDMVTKLENLTNLDSQAQLSFVETSLLQIAKTLIEQNVGEARDQNSNTTVASSDHDQTTDISTITHPSRHAHLGLSDPSTSSNPQIVVTSAAHDSKPPQVSEPTIGENEDFDDLDLDMATAALQTGGDAFQSGQWEEADSLLREALQVLQYLPEKRRAFCDVFDLRFKLAVCAFHTHSPQEAETALRNVVETPATSDKQLESIHEVTHLLSQLYVRTQQIDRARLECEKALQARRRLLGKQSDAALASTALMAHIYVLLGNRARAKTCLAMIPEARRDSILYSVEKSLGTGVEHLNFASLLTRAMSDTTDGTNSSPKMFTQSTIGTLDNEPQKAQPLGSPAPSFRQMHVRSQSSVAGEEDTQHSTMSPPPSSYEPGRIMSWNQDQKSDRYSVDLIVNDTASLRLRDPPQASEVKIEQKLSRKEILEKVGCQPKDQIEEAVCTGDHLKLVSLLTKKKDFWRSKLRKRTRPERVTALHFAALFGETDMARRLLISGFNINEIPYGYTTRLTPLTFAIGARQVDMVEFLIANGARPCEPDSWSTLAGHLMSRSWLAKTMSESEREFTPNRIVAIMEILSRHGWNTNQPIEESGKTVLHQAVAFWTGHYTWDLNLRATIASFLYEHGADPHLKNLEGKTPYEMAVSLGNQELLHILNGNLKMKSGDNGAPELYELSGHN